MVRMEIKRSIGEALPVLQFDEFGLPVNFASATLYLFCLSCTANILPLSKKEEVKPFGSRAGDVVDSHPNGEIGKGQRHFRILDRRGDSTNLI